MNFKIVTAVITAIMMICGSGVSYATSPQEAAEYKRLAEQGNAEAQHELGDLYYYGWGGLPEDKKKATEWYKKAAEQGLSGAKDALDSLHK